VAWVEALRVIIILSTWLHICFHFRGIFWGDISSNWVAGSILCQHFHNTLKSFVVRFYCHKWIIVFAINLDFVFAFELFFLNVSPISNSHVTRKAIETIFLVSINWSHLVGLSCIISQWLNFFFYFSLREQIVHSFAIIFRIEVFFFFFCAKWMKLWSHQP